MPQLRHAIAEPVDSRWRRVAEESRTGLPVTTPLDRARAIWERAVLPLPRPCRRRRRQGPRLQGLRFAGLDRGFLENPEGRLAWGPPRSTRGMKPCRRDSRQARRADGDGLRRRPARRTPTLLRAARGEMPCPRRTATVATSSTAGKRRPQPQGARGRWPGSGGHLRCRAGAAVWRKEQDAEVRQEADAGRGDRGDGPLRQSPRRPAASRATSLRALSSGTVGHWSWNPPKEASDGYCVP